MGGGLMQLVAYGAQDVYLTGQPQITFFKVVYRRHTNFSVEPIQQTFQGAAEFGRTVTCNINRNGDLVTHMYLVATLNQKARTNWGWVNKLGFAMIESCKVEVGGSKIDEQYGDWLNVYNELARNTSHDRGHNAMIGNVDHLTKIPTSATTYGEYTMYVPLKFWFNKNNGLALPLIALQYHDVRVTIKIREASKLINHSGGVSAPTVSNTEMKDCYLLIDYVYLDSEERKRFAQAAHEYLIEQVQFTGDETMNATNLKYRLNFNHPTKYLAWNVSLARYTAGNEFVEWAVDGDWDAARDRFAKKLFLATRTELESEGSGYTLSMGDSTLDLGDQPATTITAGAIKTLLDKIDCQILFANGSPGGDADAKLNNVVVLRNELTMADINQTVDELEAISTTNGTLSTAGKGFLEANGVVVRDYFNYSDDMNCEGNPVVNAKLQLNGHDRFSTRDGAYFNYVQPYQHFEVTPCDGLNVYSFALKPMEHQPSGTCNFSRIDNTTLNITSSYNTTTKRTGVARIYAVNYNIFRVMSGMGGLAYSN